MKGEKAAAHVETTLLHEIVRLGWKIAIIIVCLLLIFTLVFGITIQPDDSMTPSTKSSDITINYRLDKRYMASDVLILKYKGEKQVRRVVAVEGDVVDITENVLVVNDAPHQEEGIITETNQFEEGVEFPLTVGKGEVFVLADNRENTVDSRIYGPVKIKDTYGKVILIIRKNNI